MKTSTPEQEDDTDDGGGLDVWARAAGCGGAVGHDGVWYELFVAAAVWLATLWACGYLPRLVSFFQHARLDSNRDLLFTCLESNRALLFTGIGADPHEGAGYRGHRPAAASAGSAHLPRRAELRRSARCPRTPERWFPGTPCAPAPCCSP